MTRSKLFIIIISIAFTWLACKKSTLPEPPPVVPEETKPNFPTPIVKAEIDTSKLRGLWRIISGKNAGGGSMTWYFSGISFVQRQLDPILFGTFPPDNSTWKITSDSILTMWDTPTILKKLTSDSLVISVPGGDLWKFARLETIESDYKITTLNPMYTVNQPLGLTEDTKGNIYCAEGIGRIWRITPHNTMTVVAGREQHLPGSVIGDFGRINPLVIDHDDNLIMGGEFPQIGKVLFSENKIVKIAGRNHDLGQENVPALESDMYDVNGLALDHERNLYVCEGRRVRMISHVTGKINTIISKPNPTGLPLPFDSNPGTGLNTYVYTSGIAVDGNKNVYICDSFYHCIWKYEPTGKISLIAGSGTQGFSGDGGPAINATFYMPTGIGLDKEGNIYIADTGNHRIRKISASDKKITTIAGTQWRGLNGDWKNACLARLNSPYGIHVSSNGDILFSDRENNMVRRLTLVKK